MAKANDLVGDHFGNKVTACTELASERDQNFLITGVDDQQFVLKISNSAESREFLAGQNALLSHVAGSVDFCPRVMTTIDGEEIVAVDHEESTWLTRLVSFLPGRTMASLNYYTPDLLSDLGDKLGQLDAALADFDHPAFHRDFHWDLAAGPAVIQQRLSMITDAVLNQHIDSFVSHFEKHTSPRLAGLSRSVIHNDANDGNIVVAAPPPGQCHSRAVAGLVDFGDAVFSWTVGNLSVAIAYAMLGQDDPLDAATALLPSYHAQRPLNENEIATIWGLAGLRLCQSAAVAAEQTSARPDDPYLQISQAAIRDTLPRLLEIPFAFAHAHFRHSLGLPAEPRAGAICGWLQQHQHEFAFPVNPEMTGERPAPFETTVLNLGVDSPLIVGNPDAVSEPHLTALINLAIHRNRATLGIGQYLEPRLLYTSAHFTNDGDLADECRTVHLGMDIFAPAATPVVAPLDGEVFCATVIDKPLDYGGLVILQHSTDRGEVFYTLYGHLDPASFASFPPLHTVERGQIFAALGTPAVNGGWTPHLHFQLMVDLLDLGHEFPGVARASRADTWSAVSPDPNLVLGIHQECFPQKAPPKQQTLNQRHRLIGPSLAISYEQPLKILRGWMQYLFDETGRRYLDAYNNVPHVGHGHLDVVTAVQRQVSLLNTNTRYLHDKINELAERIVATLPDGLDVCYFLNSASEANELALRLARTSTGARDLIVLQDAYHGHSTTLIDISPYKHDGPGGSGAPDWVHVVPLPDIYRGEYTDPATAGAMYARQVATAIEQTDGPLCGFIAESCPSVGGQIMLPDGYLAAVYECVRAARGVCIADEVQTGYGRLGSHMYGFEAQGVAPDIVVLGKPIGNGFPLAAVITSRAIAD
ncbi:MAG: aminotransferase class III-fold pyridoxal phosphate-dependent enzyme, partial [Pirellulaceae bacterium]